MCVAVDLDEPTDLGAQQELVRVFVVRVQEVQDLQRGAFPDDGIHERDGRRGRFLGAETRAAAAESVH